MVASNLIYVHPRCSIAIFSFKPTTKKHTEPITVSSSSVASVVLPVWRWWLCHHLFVVGWNWRRVQQTVLHRWNVHGKLFFWWIREMGMVKKIPHTICVKYSYKRNPVCTFALINYFMPSVTACLLMSHNLVRVPNAVLRFIYTYACIWSWLIY